MKKPTKQRLALGREVIRKLATHELVTVAAGQRPTGAGDCKNSGDPDECFLTRISEQC